MNEVNLVGKINWQPRTERRLVRQQILLVEHFKNCFIAQHISPWAAAIHFLVTLLFGVTMSDLVAGNFCAKIKEHFITSFM